MSTESVAQVEAELGLSKADIEVLKGVRLIWQRLNRLRQQALKDEKAVGPYRDLLLKSIEQARAQMPPEDAEEIAKRAAAFWEWYGALCQSVGVAELERLRGRLGHMEWCQRHLPNQYAAFKEAIDKTVDLPSDQYFEEARKRAQTMLTAYCDFFK